MRYSSAFLAVLFLTLGSLSANAQELTEQQKQPWSALERQVTLWFQQDWKNHDTFIHPKAVFSGDFVPSPVSSPKTSDYIKVLLKGSNKVAAHSLIPVTVTVVDDVAIINCYLQVLKKKDGGLIEATYRLHNTWKKEGEAWLLLSTCNAIVNEGKPVE